MIDSYCLKVPDTGEHENNGISSRSRNERETDSSSLMAVERDEVKKTNDANQQESEGSRCSDDIKISEHYLSRIPSLILAPLKGGFGDADVDRMPSFVPDGPLSVTSDGGGEAQTLDVLETKQGSNGPVPGRMKSKLPSATSKQAMITPVGPSDSSIHSTSSAPANATGTHMPSIHPLYSTSKPKANLNRSKTIPSKPPYRPLPPPYLSGTPGHTQHHRRTQTFHSMQGMPGASAVNLYMGIAPAQRHGRSVTDGAHSTVGAAPVSIQTSRGSLSRSIDLSHLQESRKSNNAFAQQSCVGSLPPPPPPSGSPALSIADDPPPAIAEGTPAYDALKANANVKVTRMKKIGRKIRVSQMASKLKKLSSFGGLTSKKRGKPPRIPNVAEALSRLAWLSGAGYSDDLDQRVIREESDMDVGAEGEGDDEALPRKNGSNLPRSSSSPYTFRDRRDGKRAPENRKTRQTIVQSGVPNDSAEVLDTQKAEARALTSQTPIEMQEVGAISSRAATKDSENLEPSRSANFSERHDTGSRSNDTRNASITERGRQKLQTLVQASPAPKADAAGQHVSEQARSSRNNRKEASLLHKKESARTLLKPTHFHHPSKWRAKRRKKKRLKGDVRKSYVKGKVIDGKHELYTLSIAVMLGLRTSIGMTNGLICSQNLTEVTGLCDDDNDASKQQKAIHEACQLSENAAAAGGEKASLGDRWLESDDFMAVEKYVFRPKGGAYTPPHQLSHTFKFKDYSPMAFAYLRRLFGINEYEFLNSVCGNANFIEFISNAKSGQFFFYSNDGKYMIKTMTNTESKFLRRMLPHYFRHCSQYPNTLITKFLGMYRVKLYHLKRNVKFIIMNSVFDTDKFLSSFYDVKGSKIGRDSKQGEDVKKDNDVRRMLPENGFVLNPAVRERMREQLVADCDFFKHLKIMDYSMLIGVHRIPLLQQQARDGLKAFLPSRYDADSIRNLFDERAKRNQPRQTSLGRGGRDRDDLLGKDIVKRVNFDSVAGHPAGLGDSSHISLNSTPSASPNRQHGPNAGIPNCCDTKGDTSQGTNVEDHGALHAEVGMASSLNNFLFESQGSSARASSRLGVQVVGSTNPEKLLSHNPAESLEDLTSLGTGDVYYDDDDEYSYLEGYRHIRSSFASMRRDNCDCLIGPVASIIGSTIITEELEDEASVDICCRKVQLMEDDKELAIEQIYWPFHRFYNIHGWRRMEPIAISRNLEATVEALGLSSSDIPVFQRPISDRKDNGLLLDVNHCTNMFGREPEGKIFYMGIIDVLQQFNIRKRMEAKYRRIRGSGWADASCVHPNLYADRFLQFFDEYTVRNHIPVRCQTNRKLSSGHAIPSPSVLEGKEETGSDDNVEEVHFELAAKTRDLVDTL